MYTFIGTSTRLSALTMYLRGQQVFLFRHAVQTLGNLVKWFHFLCFCKTLQGRGAMKGHLRRRIAVTLSIFYFRRWFLVQIVEDRRGRLSRPFLSPGDNFSKSYDENQIWSERTTGVHTRRAGGFRSLSQEGSNPWVRAACALPFRPNLVFVITFRWIIPRT